MTMSNKLTSVNNVTREVEFGSLDGGDDGERNGLVLVGIFKRFELQIDRILGRRFLPLICHFTDY